MSSQDEETTIEETEEQRQRRKELRHQYHLKKKEIRLKEPDLTNDAALLNEELLKVDVIFSNARDYMKPREAVLDSGLVHSLAVMGQAAAKNVSTEFQPFQPLKFAEDAVTFMSGGRVPPSGGNPVSAEGWAYLGAATQKYLSTTPTFSFMLGSFERGTPIAKARKSKPDRQQEKEDDARAKVVKPKELKAPEGEKTAEIVERILELLKNYCVVNEGPVCYFEFVTNPHSFGQTVENIFHVSFLIKEGKVRLAFDGDELPNIEPVLSNAGNGADAPTCNSQFVMTISMDQWEEIIKVFEIKEPLIPTRLSSSAKSNGPKEPKAGSSRNRD